MNKCIDCGVSIYKYSVRCRRCANLGKNNPMFGKRNLGKFIDGRTKKQYFCIDCNKSISGYQHKRCWACRNKYIGKLLEKDNNPNWKNGSYYIKRGYNIEFNNRLKREIKQRDRYICQICGIKEADYKQKLDIHHIDCSKQNDSQGNLITLCRDCHIATHWGKKHVYHN